MKTGNSNSSEKKSPTETRFIPKWNLLILTQMKQLSGSKAYTRIAQCVPARKESYKNIHTNLATFWFDCFTERFSKDDRLRAQGEFWFVHLMPEKDKIFVAVLDGDYWETPVYNPEYNESLNDIVYFDTRHKTILDGGYAFVEGETYVLKYPDGNIIYVQQPNSDIKTPLTLIVDKVDEKGTLLEYK